MDFKNIKIENAICYSGYRQGQNPGLQIFPSYEQVKEDLIILNSNWNYIRLYDATKHSETVLEVISNEKLDLKVMVGTCLSAEINNNGCPWGGNNYSEEQLSINKDYNKSQIKSLIKLANKYPNIIFSVSAGNEATVDWTDHLVPEESVIEYVKMLKNEVKQPVTFCENYVPWLNKLSRLAEEVDFISLHTYPVWEFKPIEEAINYSKENYYSVKEKYPNKPIVITEAGWPTNSNGRGIPPENANEELQKKYYEDLINWSKESGIPIFLFEAFDEDWKGSTDSMEPEKHWGLFNINRKPKKVLENLYSEL